MCPFNTQRCPGSTSPVSRPSSMGMLSFGTDTPCRVRSHLPLRRIPQPELSFLPVPSMSRKGPRTFLGALPPSRFLMAVHAHTCCMAHPAALTWYQRYEGCHERARDSSSSRWPAKSVRSQTWPRLSRVRMEQVQKGGVLGSSPGPVNVEPRRHRQRSDASSGREAVAHSTAPS